MRPRPLVLLALLVFACGPFISDSGPDSTLVFRDSGEPEPDGGFFIPDTGLDPNDAGLFSCADFCEAYGAALQDETLTQLRRHGVDPTCVTEDPGLAECATTCEAEEASAACLECSADRSMNCNSVCDLKRPTNGRGALETHRRCWYGRTRPSESCSTYESITGFYGSLRPEGNFGMFSMMSYTGTATVVSTSPLVLRTTAGENFAIEVEGAGFSQLSNGETLHLEFTSNCPFGCLSAFVVRTTSEVLIAAGWSGRLPLEMPEIELVYAPRECVGVAWAYSQAIDFDLFANGQRVPVGRTVDVAGLRVANGRSVVHYSVMATDHPHVWTAGLIVPAG